MNQMLFYQPKATLLQITNFTPEQCLFRKFKKINHRMNRILQGNLIQDAQLFHVMYSISQESLWLLHKNIQGISDNNQGNMGYEMILRKLLLYFLFHIIQRTKNYSFIGNIGKTK